MSTLATRSYLDNELHRSAMSPVYSDADLEQIEQLNRPRPCNLDDRIDARFEVREATIDELIRRRLSVQQLQAIDLLLAGMCDADVARAVKVHRATVARWRLYQPAFVAEMNRRRKAEIQATADRLRRLAMRSIEILEAQLEDESNPMARVRAAACLLRMAGVDSAVKRNGATSAEEVIDEIVLDRRPRRPSTLIDNGERREALEELARRSETVAGLELPEPDADPAPVPAVNEPAAAPQAPAQHTGESESDCCAIKSSMVHDLGSEDATNATAARLSEPRLHLPAEAAQYRVQT